MFVQRRAPVLHHGRIHPAHPVQSHLRLTHPEKGFQDIREHICRCVALCCEHFLQHRIPFRRSDTRNYCQSLYTVVRNVLITRSYIARAIPELLVEDGGYPVHHLPVKGGICGFAEVICSLRLSLESEVIPHRQEGVPVFVVSCIRPVPATCTVDRHTIGIQFPDFVEIFVDPVIDQRDYREVAGMEGIAP